ncbi:hypothetical protein C0995_011451, partial [Termitomyces sp. Mi166
MASKILLLHVTANASLLEHECAAQEFINAADAVFFKAQCVNIWHLNKQAPWAAEFGKMV